MKVGLAFAAVFASQIYALATLRLPPFSGKDKTSLAKYFSKNLGIAYGCTQNFSSRKHFRLRSADTKRAWVCSHWHENSRPRCAL
ncbi:MAG: hypothetical protein ACI31C_06200, partial [Muribaculaceae bacterium]